MKPTPHTPGSHRGPRKGRHAERVVEAVTHEHHIHPSRGEVPAEYASPNVPTPPVAPRAFQGSSSVSPAAILGYLVGTFLRKSERAIDEVERLLPKRLRSIATKARSTISSELQRAFSFGSETRGSDTARQ